MSIADELRDFHGRWTAGGQGDNGAKSITKSLQGKRDDDARGAVNSGKAADTQKIHTNAKGEYTPEREALHRAIIQHFMGHSEAQASPQAIFTAGGAASGKSTLAGQKLNDDGSKSEANLPVPKGSVYINPDDIKAMLPEYRSLHENGRDDVAAAATHEESSQIAKALAAVAMANHRHIIVDGTGNSGVGKFGNKIRAALAAGYKVKARYAHIPVKEAIVREKKRAIRTGRKVDEKVLRGQHQTVSKGYADDVRHIPGVHVEIYSTLGRGRPTLIADQPAHRPNRVINAKQYREHLDKATVSTTQPKAMAA